MIQAPLAWAKSSPTRLKKVARGFDVLDAHLCFASLDLEHDFALQQGLQGVQLEQHFCHLSCGPFPGGGSK